MMKTVEQIKVHFDDTQSETFEIIEEALPRVVRILKDDLQLSIPADCRIYVMDGWFKFLFKAAPVYLFPLLGLNLLFAWPGIKRSWPSVGGWAKRYGKRHVIGIKDKSLIKLSGSELGQRVFVPEKTLKDKIAHILTHELTHACLVDKKMPGWLNEGIAMLSVDKLLNKQTVLDETLESLAIVTVETLRRDMLSRYITGYWFARYLYEEELEMLKRLLDRQNMYEDDWIKGLPSAFEAYRNRIVAHYKGDLANSVGG